jgi:hypothetical protein
MDQCSLKFQSEQIQALTDIERQLRLELQTSRAEKAQCQRDNRQIIASLSERNAILIEESELLRSQLVTAQEQLDQQRYKHVETVVEATCDEDNVSLLQGCEVDQDQGDQSDDDENVDTEESEEQIGDRQGSESDLKGPLASFTDESEGDLRTHEKSDDAENPNALPGSSSPPSIIELLRHNRNLAVTLRQCREKMKGLEAQVSELTQQLARSMAELNVAKGIESEALRTASLSKQELDAAKNDMEALQCRLAALEIEGAACRSSLEETKNALEQQCQQTDVLSRKLCRSEAEARVARAVANDLMGERCDAQAFLSSSLRFVKTILRAKNNGTDADKETKEGKGDRTGPGTLLRSAVASRRLSDVSDMTWEEREDVLRLLIVQINGRYGNKKRDRQEALNPVEEGAEELHSAQTVA